MLEGSSHSAPEGHRRRRRKLTPDEKLLRDRIVEASAVPQDEKADPVKRERPHRETRPDQGPRSGEPREAEAHLLLLKGCRRLFKLATRTFVLIYLPLLLGLCWFVSRFGQSNLTSAGLMYLPPTLWIAPAFVLMAAALLFDWKSLPLLAIGIVCYAGIYLHYQWRPEKGLSTTVPFETVRVLTWNRGQGKHASLKTIKEQLKPDFILLQDAAGRSAGYRKDPGYAEFREIIQAGEFILMSRWPVLSAQVVAESKQEHLPGSAVAARFVVVAAGNRVVLYSVHLPSPRDQLESYKGGAFLWGILGFPGTPWESKKQHYQAFWDNQMSLAKSILDRATQEADPTLIMGDFNTPDAGPIYQAFSAVYQDAHRAVGSGLGCTFPGDTRNPLALFQPWLRLDQIFASDDWEILQCMPQSASAQHLPLFGEVKLNKQARP